MLVVVETIREPQIVRRFRPRELALLAAWMVGCGAAQSSPSHADNDNDVLVAALVAAWPHEHDARLIVDRQGIALVERPRDARAVVDYLTRELSPVSAEMVLDYIERNRPPGRRLERLEGAPFPYELVSDHALERVGTSGSLPSHLATVSEPAFSADRRYALVCVSIRQDRRAGSGICMLLTRDGGGWRSIARALMWRS